MLASASGVLAQLDYEYDYTYDATGDAAAAGVSVFMLSIWCCSMVFGLLMFAFNIWMLIHAIQKAPEDQKILWILIIFFVPFGSVAYFFMKKKEWDKK